MWLLDGFFNKGFHFVSWGKIVVKQINMILKHSLHSVLKNYDIIFVQLVFYFVAICHSEQQIYNDVIRGLVINDDHIVSYLIQN